MIDISDISYHAPGMTPKPSSQHDRALSLLGQKGMARLTEFTDAGVTAATVSRMKEKGLITQLSRGLYQLPNAPLDANHSLAEAAKLIPKGVVCLVSALAFHELTDTIPSRVWMAIGSKDRQPRITRPAIQFVRFKPELLRAGVENHVIENVSVRVTNPARTVVDLFRYRRRAGIRYRHSPGPRLAIEGLKEVLRQRKATPSELARYAAAAGMWKVMQPYIEAITTDG
jgi:Transcriptional regulator, AbiEi antitoxin